MNIKSINNSTAKTLRSTLEVVLQNTETAKMLEELGIEISVGRGTYSTSEITFKVSMALKDADGEAMTREREALKTRFPDCVDKEVRLHNGMMVKIVEYHARKSKYPFIGEASNGKRYKLPLSMVQF